MWVCCMVVVGFLCGFCAVAVWFFLEIWNEEQIKIELHSVVLVGILWGLG
jgi:hypothetical protein